ncbi:hypothetical protein [Acinetobacter sp. SWBY1]|uniref:hypothetical protein n=1 Tax=Acinetobacter sp. SWBY1 TaxID=2079596 RepID=UPI000CF26B38|nr:hypothetical protein [Acinetobacter sp. SWBY1]AVH49678.1 hypothetical protein C3Y93_08620 [Acinetobacter sp. SWBY1]
MNKNPPPKQNGFVLAWEFIWKQTKKPADQSTFWMYLFLGILLLGGLGFWFEFLKFLANKATDSSAMKTALILFAPPIINTSAIQLCLSKNDVKLHTKSTLIIFIVLVNLTCILLLFFDPQFSSYKFWLPMIFILIFTLWASWIQSSLNTDLYDTPPKQASIGGTDLDKPLNGDIPDGFKS